MEKKFRNNGKLVTFHQYTKAKTWNRSTDNIVDMGNKYVDA